jgi:hypothetical protein
MGRTKRLNKGKRLGIEGMKNRKKTRRIDNMMMGEQLEGQKESQLPTWAPQ